MKSFMKNDQGSRTVVITGASAGVGRATARAFAKTGARMGLLARGHEGLEAARREVEALGGQAIAIPTDVSDAVQVETAASKVENTFGPIDVWVNDAMVSVFSPASEMTPQEFRRVTEVTYLGYVHGTMSALKRMRPRDRGIVIQIGSALGYRSIPLQSAYCAAKHAIVGFTESLRSELMHEGCNVFLTMINLPAVNTPQFGWSKSRMPRKPQPVPPIYQPEVIAKAVVWAADHKRRVISIAPSTLRAVYAEKIIPGLVDRYLAKAGYDSQQTDEPVSPDRRDNLWSPVPGDAGAHGTFDDRARGFSLQLWLNLNRTLVAGVLAAAGIAFLLVRKKTRVREIPSSVKGKRTFLELEAS
jgi:NAD(P)-dependent dehydrogenase (short-subunit alcohol dehydrogenase family)